MIYLDQLVPEDRVPAQDQKPVAVEGRAYQHFFQVHDPVLVVYHLAGAFEQFRCRVAFSPEVPAFRADAEFVVRVDDRTFITYVVAGQAPQRVQVDVRDAQRLELAVHTNHQNGCSVLWLEPTLTEPRSVRRSTRFSSRDIRPNNGAAHRSCYPHRS